MNLGPPDYEKNLLHDVISSISGSTITLGASQQISVVCNAVQIANAMTGSEYVVKSMMQTLNSYLDSRGMTDLMAEDKIESVNLYNPTMNYILFMLPVTIHSIIIMLGSNITTAGISSDIENGTIDIINVSPISRGTFLMSKVVVFSIIGMMEVGYVMFISWTVYDLVPNGSYPALLLTVFLFII